MQKHTPPFVLRMRQARAKPIEAIVVQPIPEKPKDLGSKVLRYVEVFAVFTVFLSVIAFFLDLQDKPSQRAAQAWQIVTTKAKGNSGKIASLQYLNSEDWRARITREWRHNWEEREEVIGWPEVIKDPVAGKPDTTPWWGNFFLSILEIELIPIKHRISLTGIDLSSDEHLSKIDLSEADLSGSDLSDSTFLWANLSGADLGSATLTDASFGGANLSGADLIHAHMDGAFMDGADLSGADLRGAAMNGINLEGADLSSAILGFERGFSVDSQMGGAEFAKGLYLKGLPPTAAEYYVQQGLLEEVDCTKKQEHRTHEKLCEKYARRERLLAKDTSK